MIRLIVWLIAVLSALSAFAQPLERMNLRTSAMEPNPKEQGRQCYKGLCCNSSNSDCSAKTSTLACYNCCQSNGCTDSALTWCQEYCDGNARMAGDTRTLMHDTISAEFIVRNLAEAYENLDDWALNEDQIWALDYAIGAHPVESVRKLAFVLLLTAYDDGRIIEFDGIDELVGEIHHTALFHMTDTSLESSARIIAVKRGILGARDRGEDMVNLMRQLSAQPTDDVDWRLIEIFMRN